MLSPEKWIGKKRGEFCLTIVIRKSFHWRIFSSQMPMKPMYRNNPRSFGGRLLLTRKLRRNLDITLTGNMLRRESIRWRMIRILFTDKVSRQNFKPTKLKSYDTTADSRMNILS